MKPKLLALVAVVGLLAVAVVWYAGLFAAQPSPSQPAWRVGPQAVSLTVVIDPSIDTPRLTIPRSLLVTTERKTGVLGIASPVMTGLALSSSLVFGGFWLAGRARRRGVLIAAGAFAFLVLGTEVLLANMPTAKAPPSQPKTDEVELPASISLPKNIQLVIVETGDSIRLTLPMVAPNEPNSDTKWTYDFTPGTPPAIVKPVTPDK